MPQHISFSFFVCCDPAGQRNKLDHMATTTHSCASAALWNVWTRAWINRQQAQLLLLCYTITIQLALEHAAVKFILRFWNKSAVLCVLCCVRPYNLRAQGQSLFLIFPEMSSAPQQMFQLCFKLIGTWGLLTHATSGTHFLYRVFFCCCS